MMETESEAHAWLETLPEYDSVARDRVARLVALLREENQRQNLVSAATLNYVWQRHIADSAQLLSLVPRGTSGVWMDLGTGAGFPGIVVAALRPRQPVVLVESRGRRVEWLEHLKQALDLSFVTIVGQRLELVADQRAAVLSARAFAPLNKLITLASRFSTSETVWLLPKGRSAQQELAELRGWRHTFHVEQSLTDAQAGIIVGALLGKKGKGT